MVESQVKGKGNILPLLSYRNCKVTEQRPGHREGSSMMANQVICCSLPFPLQLLISLSHAKYTEPHLRNHKIFIQSCIKLYQDLVIYHIQM